MIALFACGHPSDFALSIAIWGDLIHFLSFTRISCQTRSLSFFFESKSLQAGVSMCRDDGCFMRKGR